MEPVRISLHSTPKNKYTINNGNKNRINPKYHKKQLRTENKSYNITVNPSPKVKTLSNICENYYRIGLLQSQAKIPFPNIKPKDSQKLRSSVEPILKKNSLRKSDITFPKKLPDNSEKMKNGWQSANSVPVYFTMTFSKPTTHLTSVENLVSQRYQNSTRNASPVKYEDQLEYQSTILHRSINISSHIKSTCTSREKKYYYMIGKGGNYDLVKRILDSKSNWREVTNASHTFHFKWQDIAGNLDYSTIEKNKQMVNHLEYHSTITNKLNLFINLMKLCENKRLELFNFVPFTIMMQYDSPSFQQQFAKFSNFFQSIEKFLFRQGKNRVFEKYFNYFKLGIANDRIGIRTNMFIPDCHYEQQNIWLVKAIDLNRGRCIKLGSTIPTILENIKNFSEGVVKDFKMAHLEEKNELKTKKFKKIRKNSYDFKLYRSTCVLLQKYIEKPLLYYGRKFDIRIWVLYTHKNTVYAFREGHLKTSSSIYSVQSPNCFVHFTNYSVQKYSQDFSRFEYGNEVSFRDFQLFLNKEGFDINVHRDIFTTMKKIISLTFHSVRDKINAYERKFCFEIFGFDFILDQSFQVYLLEVNTNPGLEESSPLIKIIVPRMLDDAFKLTIDDVFGNKIASTRSSQMQMKRSGISHYPVDGYSNEENLW